MTNALAAANARKQGDHAAAEQITNPPEKVDPRQLIRVREACAILKISPPTFYTRLVGEGRIELKKVGGVGVSRVELGDVYALIEDK